ncbi:MAG: M20 family metallopeptidase [Anaerolineae bacterium]
MPEMEPGLLAAPPTVDYFQSQLGAMLALLENLVAQDTPASSKVNLDRMVRQMAQQLSSAGGTVEVLPQADMGDILRATWDGAGGVGGQVLVLGHLDTVWPLGEAAQRPFRIEDGLAFGPGVLDMKAGLVELVFAMRGLASLSARPARRVVALLTCDEEVGSPGSRELIEVEARRSQAVLVLEPAMPDGALKTARKGWGLFHLAVHGRAAHAGANPQSGVSAIEELARQISYLHNLTDYDLGTTVNVGVVRGGTRPNVIAADADAEIDVRVTTLAEAERILPAIRDLKPCLIGSQVEVSGGWNRPPMERTAGNAALFERARLLARGLGFDVAQAASGAASDGNFAAALGIPTLDGLGAVGVGPHAEDEYIEVASLPQRTALLACLLADVELLEAA